MKKKKIIRFLAISMGVYAVIKSLKKNANVGMSVNRTSDPMPKDGILIVINGESNAGGLASNIDLTPDERKVFEGVYIYNADRGEFEPMQVGNNNNTGHEGLNSDYMHGFELGIGLAVRNGTLPTPLYIVKTGQGGSKIKEWENGTVYYQKMVNRVNYATTFLANRGIATRNFIVYTQGINDAVKGPTPTEVWKTSTMDHFMTLRSLLGNCPILFVKHMNAPELGDYIKAIDELAGVFPGVYPIDSTGAPLLDQYHWNYEGMKLISSRIVSTIKTLLTV